MFGLCVRNCPQAVTAQVEGAAAVAHAIIDNIKRAFPVERGPWIPIRNCADKLSQRLEGCTLG